MESLGRNRVGVKGVLATFDPANIRVKDLMSPGVATIKRSASLAEATKVMTERGIGSLIVVDETGRMVGIITERDVLRACASRGVLGDLKVEDVMTKDVVTVKADTRLADAVHEMVRHNIRHLPVVDDSGNVVGMFSMRDAMRGVLRILVGLLMHASSRQSPPPTRT